MNIKKPIFIVGHARGGSTAIASIVNYHRDVGPKPKLIQEATSFNDALNGTFDRELHLEYSDILERKNLWFSVFGGSNVFTHMGIELVAEGFPQSVNLDDFKCKLVGELREARFMSKAPTNSFRVRAIRSMFPDAKIIAILRYGEQVVASWGNRSYGFNQPVSSCELNTKSLSYIQGIRVFSRKWEETTRYLLENKESAGVFCVNYDSLVDSTKDTLEELFDYLELTYCEGLGEVLLNDQRSVWKKTIPMIYHPYLRGKVKRYNKLIQTMCDI